MKEILRAEYVDDCQRGVDKWKRVFESRGLPHRLALPSRRFHRNVGAFANVRTDPNGTLITQEAFDATRDEWLPSVADRTFVSNLMARPVYDS